MAATAATEHFTAVFANWLMRHPEALDGAEPLTEEEAEERRRVAERHRGRAAHRRRGERGIVKCGGLAQVSDGE